MSKTLIFVHCYGKLLVFVVNIVLWDGPVLISTASLTTKAFLIQLSPVPVGIIDSDLIPGTDTL